MCYFLLCVSKKAKKKAPLRTLELGIGNCVRAGSGGPSERTPRHTAFVCTLCWRSVGGPPMHKGSRSTMNSLMV